MAEITGIIGAMDSEVEQILAAMTSKEKIEINKYVFYKGQLFGKAVVLTKCGIGKVNAALGAQLLILNFGVNRVVNSGIAGAVGEGLNIYDFVISTSAVYHDFDTSFFGYKLGQVPGLPESFEADKKLVTVAEKAFAASNLSKEHKTKKGLVASGDQFIAGGERKDRIVSTFHPFCVEMEGCAVAHTCYVNNIPFVILRCMSDAADENVKTQYSEDIASKISSSFLLEFIKEL